MGALLTPGLLVLDATGEPAVNARVQFYENGTTTPKEVFLDENRDISAGSELFTNAQGYAANSSGNTLFYLAATKYSIRITSSDNEVLRTWDNILGLNTIEGVATGNDGDSVFVTYNDSALDMTPAAPTGDGTSGGWQRDPDLLAGDPNWQSVKTGTDVNLGTWSQPFPVAGADGATGPAGMDGTDGTDGTDGADGVTVTAIASDFETVAAVPTGTDAILGIYWDFAGNRILVGLQGNGSVAFTNHTYEVEVYNSTVTGLDPVATEGGIETVNPKGSAIDWTDNADVGFWGPNGAMGTMGVSAALFDAVGLICDSLTFNTTVRLKIRNRNMAIVTDFFHGTNVVRRNAPVGAEMFATFQGAPLQTEYRWLRSATQPSTPTGNDPVGWFTSPPAGSNTLWLSQAQRQTAGAMEIVGAWSTPDQATGESGLDGTVYAFQNAATQPATPTPNGTTVPAGWTDGPTVPLPAGQSLWASTTVDGGGNWNTPFQLNGNDGADGADGANGTNGINGTDGVTPIVCYLDPSSAVVNVDDTGVGDFSDATSQVVVLEGLTDITSTGRVVITNNGVNGPGTAQLNTTANSDFTGAKGAMRWTAAGTAGAASSLRVRIAVDGGTPIDKTFSLATPVSVPTAFNLRVPDVQAYGLANGTVNVPGVEAIPTFGVPPYTVTGAGWDVVGAGLSLASGEFALVPVVESSGTDVARQGTITCTVQDSQVPAVTLTVSGTIETTHGTADPP